MSLDILITTAGRAAIVNAQNNGTNAVTITEIGLTETAIVPTVADIALPGEFKRIDAVSGQVVADDIIHISFSDESADAYSLRGFALYLDDGTLFGIYGQALPILEKTAVSIGAISIDIEFADISAANVTFGNSEFVNPPATTEVKGVVELATVAEAQAGIDALRVLTPAAARAAILGWLLAQDGAGSGIDADLVDGIQGSQLVRNDLSGTINGQLTLTGSASMVNLRPATADHCYIAYYPSVANPANRYASLGFTNAGTHDFSIVNDYGGHINLLTYPGSTVHINGFGAWHVGNDGAGSGLDADMVDGLQASQLVRNDSSNTINGRLTLSGYQDILNLKSGAANNVFIGFYPVAADQNLRTAYIGYPFSGSNNLTLDNQNGGNIDLRVNGAGNVTINGNIIWHAANDGAGSGADADLLDGQQGSYYADVPARLGYIPLNSDGNGAVPGLVRENSSIGQLGGFARTPFEIRGNGVGPAFLSFHRPGSYAFHFGLDTDNRLKYGGWSVANQSVEIWHAASDGSGSGLDADLLDGIDGSQYLRVIAENKTNTGGYRVTSDGHAQAWGSLFVPANAQNLYVAFPAAVDFNLPPVVTSSSVRPGAAAQDNPPGVQSVTANGFYISSASDAGETLWWHAIGYR